MNYTTKLNQYIAEDRLIRHAWTGSDKQGRKTACLMAAMSPEVASSRDVSACPADIMPQWLAHLTPWIDDSGSDDAWHGMVRRYAAVAARWHALSDEIWRRLDYTARRIALEDCLQFAGDAAPAVGGVIALLRQAEAGADVTRSEWAAAWAAAKAAEAAAWDAWAAARAAAEGAAWAAAEGAAWAAAWAAAKAAEAAAWDAWAAAWDARAAAEGAAWAAADAAAKAAEAAAWAAADAAARVAAGAAAADRITAAILSAIEAACDEAEKGVKA